MNLMCLCPSHPWKFQFSLYHKCSVCTAAFVTFYIIPSNFSTPLSQTLFSCSLSSFTLSLVREKMHICVWPRSLSPSLLPPIVSAMYPFLHGFYTGLAAVDDCWGRVHNGGSLETGVQRFIMEQSPWQPYRAVKAHTHKGHTLVKRKNRK